jgi:hypothetical protein
MAMHSGAKMCVFVCMCVGEYLFGISSRNFKQLKCVWVCVNISKISAISGTMSGKCFTSFEKRFGLARVFVVV